MKPLTFILAILMVAATGLPLRAEMLKTPTPNPKDTIFIKLPNGAGMNLIVKNTDELKSLKDYKLDSLIQMLGKYVEQIENMEKANRYQEGKELTMTFYPAKDQKDPSAPEKITITLSASSVSTMHDKAKSKGFIEGIKIFVEHQENKKNNSTVDKDSVKVAAKKEKANRRITSQSFADVGLNTFVNVPKNSGDTYDLRSTGSRFVNLVQYYRIRIGSQGSPFYLKPGLELTFNNYMFDKNNYLIDDNGVSRIVKETTRSFEKSKLATSSINASLMPELRFREKSGKDGFKIGMGGFVGYRLGSHTKLKYQLEGDTEKDKERSSYNLEDFQYGVNFAIGYRKFEVYTKYNLNNLFKENRGPQMNVISFGFRI
ncbi:hypothetical protein AAE02nite_44480 [Adhaeribacter aerolatus]|uniref:Outer membrane protein beta-barrel domain-containing protein n=1 Tax=Adhaeribacter aerolatus TaxID=670289 RepID=A0A512B4A1_9BACT|nr:PorT family protein [Adhaeribacter aerolatus]GEO06784.1 hypothetical protein AAE02nite_44480 [Adhaeribacter aerolatus]